MLLEFTMVWFLLLVFQVFVIYNSAVCKTILLEKYTYVWQCWFNGFGIFSINRLSLWWALCTGNIPINGTRKNQTNTRQYLWPKSKTHTNRPSGGGGGASTGGGPLFLWRARDLYVKTGSSSQSNRAVYIRDRFYFIFTEGPRTIRDQFATSHQTGSKSRCNIPAVALGPTEQIYIYIYI